MQKITANCIPALGGKSSGMRPLSAVRYIVLHSTESSPGTQEAIANYFQSPIARGSAHIVVGDGSCYRTVRDTEIPWAAPGKNTDGFHIEQVGRARWPKAGWLLHQPMLHRVAFKMAQAAVRFKVPLVVVDAAGIAAGKAGVTTHAEVSKWAAAHNVPGDHSHWDPGPGYPLYYVVLLARAYRKTLARKG